MYSKRAVLTLRVVALTLLSSCCDVSLSHPVCQYLYLHVCVTLSVKFNLSRGARAGKVRGAPLFYIAKFSLRAKSRTLFGDFLWRFLFTSRFGPSGRDTVLGTRCGWRCAGHGTMRDRQPHARFTPKRLLSSNLDFVTSRRDAFLFWSHGPRRLSGWLYVQAGRTCQRPFFWAYHTCHDDIASSHNRHVSIRV